MINLHEDINKAIDEIVEYRGKIIDDFCKAYLASFDPEVLLTFKKQGFKGLKLIEKSSADMLTRTYSFSFKELEENEEDLSSLISSFKHEYNEEDYDEFM